MVCGPTTSVRDCFCQEDEEVAFLERLTTHGVGAGGKSTKVSAAREYKGRMKFRPCIDLHNGQVKQIVGSTLVDEDRKEVEAGGEGVTSSSTSSSSSLEENFSTDRPASDYARMYRRDGLTGGHVIMLGGGNEDAALSALSAYPGGLQVGGGITS